MSTKEQGSDYKGNLILSAVSSPRELRMPPIYVFKVSLPLLILVTFSDLWISLPKACFSNIVFWSCTWDVRLHIWSVSQSRVIKASGNSFDDIGIHAILSAELIDWYTGFNEPGQQACFDPIVKFGFGVDVKGLSLLSVPNHDDIFRRSKYVEITVTV